MAVLGWHTVNIQEPDLTLYLKYDRAKAGSAHQFYATRLKPTSPNSVWNQRLGRTSLCIVFYFKAETLWKGIATPVLNIPALVYRRREGQAHLNTGANTAGASGKNDCTVIGLGDLLCDC